MKQFVSKIYFAFFSLFILLISVSGFTLFNAFDTYKENQNLRTESVEIVNRLYSLEYLTAKMSLLGQKHVLAITVDEMNDYNMEIDRTFNALNELMVEIQSNGYMNETENFYSSFKRKWDRCWSFYFNAINTSKENNNEESQKLLLKAINEFDELNTFYLNPMERKYYQLFTKLNDRQTENFKKYLVVGIILLIAAIVGFIYTFYFLRKILKDTVLLKEKLKFLAYHDPLTNLPNRRMFQSQVIELINEPAGTFALMYLDMDNFKDINDNYGHDIGDLVIVDFVKRVNGCIRDTDIMGRQGGDEFTILLKEISEQEIIEVADRIIKSFQKPLYVNGESIHISTSIGIAIYPKHGKDYMVLLKHADTALYEAKQNRNIYRIVGHVKALDEPC